MSNPRFSPPGSSTYDSDTIFVGDGTWDSERNSFLLPNLEGLNFDTTRYNGMGNRFRGLSQYHSIVRAHGVLAAITFLGLVPAAIMIARFYHRNPRLALRLHIWLQISTVFMATVVFVLGWFAVGPERSLSNPHHSIGLTIYVLIIVQVIGGWWVHHREKKKMRYKLPIKLMLHQWFGRAIAILALAQIPLGLALYGSPAYLYVLYSLYMAFLVLLYFILTYRHQQAITEDDMGSYVTGSGYGYTETQTSHHGHHRGLKALAAAGVAGAGLKAFKSRSRTRQRENDDGHTAGSYGHSRRDSDSVIDEKLASDPYNRQNTWKKRLLGATAGIGAIAALKGIFGGNKQASTVTDSSSYSGRLQGSRTYSQEDFSRVEEGRAPSSPEHGRHRRDVDHRSSHVDSPARGDYRGGSLASYDTWENDSPSRNARSFGIREGVATLGLAGYLRHKMKSSSGYNDRRPEGSRQDDVRNERLARRKSQRYTGDGYTPRRNRRRDSLSDFTPVVGSNPELSRHGAVPVQSSVDSRRDAENTQITQENSTVVSLPPPPPQPQFVPVDREHQSPSSKVRGNSENRQQRKYRRSNDVVDKAGDVPIAGPSTGAMQRESDSTGGSMVSPPLSVKLNVHKDGRHVTLRRLNEAEAAAERETRRRERAGRRQRAGSLTSGAETGDERWRRTENRDPAQTRQSRRGESRTRPSKKPAPDAEYSDLYNSSAAMPPQPPPPITSPSAMDRTVTSPGHYETGTDVSNYDSNRRRRRAERAQAKLARAGGSRVEFE